MKTSKSIINKINKIQERHDNAEEVAEYWDSSDAQKDQAVKRMEKANEALAVFVKSLTEEEFENSGIGESHLCASFEEVQLDW